MEKFGKSQPVKRLEDQRFLTGAGRYVADIAPEDALHAVILRSDVGHGVLNALDLEDARAMPGVALALGAAELDEMGIDFTLQQAVLNPRVDGTAGARTERRIFARDRVRFVGDPLAIIVADTLSNARDAAEAIFADIDELPVKVDLAPGGEALHDTAPENVAFDWTKGDLEKTRGVIEGAAHVVRTRVVDNRVIPNSMEPRACLADWRDGRLHFAFGGQGVWGTRDSLAKCLKLDKDAVHVTIPDVGGGFGTKGMDYPEYFACAIAARELGRPVLWLSGRTEAMLSDNAGRDLVSETELAFDADYRLIAYHADTLANMGAYNSEFAQPIQTRLFVKVASGVYDVQDVSLRTRGIFTNTTQVDAYRGAGRPEAIFALERSMDNAARALGVDPWELRRRNFVRPDQMPYKTALADTYDSGDFDRVLTRLDAECDRAGFADRRAASEAGGKLRGMGLCYYIESILGDPDETAKVVFNEDGTVDLLVGTQSNGQGHETVYATFLSDQTGIPLEAIRIVQGDSDLVKHGGGTGGSRSVTVQNTATLATVSTMRKAFADYLGEKMDSDDVQFDDERFRIAGSNETPSILDVAAMARADGRTELLQFQETIKLEARSFPNGGHVAEVEIDPDTGVVSLDRYTVTDDFGNLINPMLAEGQVHGGVAQGVGQALCERVVYDDNAQLLTATFMDYAMPRAYDLPMIGFTTEAVPTPGA